MKRLQAENPWHAEKIQQILFGQAYQTVNASNSVYQLVHSFSVLSRVKSRWRFNGFFFRVNMNLIKAAAHGVDLLFDPRDVMVEQENHLVESMSREKMFPVVAISAFVYHHKSATVGSARMPLPAQHAALLGINSSTGSATVHSYFYFHNESGVLKRFDRRENLRYYHQNKTLPGNSQTTREYVNYAVERQTEVERCLVALRDVSICESWTMVLIVPSHWSIAVDSLLPSVVYVERASGEAAEMQLKVPKRENWYKPALYTTADLIVVADSDFLLSSVLRSHWLHKNQYRMSARATMIACALVSNSSLQEVDSIGNYDAFIALNRSVPTAAAAFPMQCTTGCPAVFTAANTTTFISTKSSARSETDADIRSLTGENGVKEVFLPIQELGTNLSGMTLTQLESITKAIVRTFPFLVSGKPK